MYFIGLKSQIFILKKIACMLNPLKHFKIEISLYFFTLEAKFCPSELTARAKPRY